MEGLRQAGRLDAKVVQLQPQLGGELAQPLVARVDQLPAELDDHALWETAGEAQHPASDPLLRLEHPHGHPRLLQPIGSGQPGEPSADDEDLLPRDLRPFGKRRASRHREAGEGGGAGFQGLAARRRRRTAGLRRGRSAVDADGGPAQRAAEGEDERGTSHA